MHYLTPNIQGMLMILFNEVLLSDEGLLFVMLMIEHTVIVLVAMEDVSKFVPMPSRDYSRPDQTSIQLELHHGNVGVLRQVPYLSLTFVQLILKSLVSGLRLFNANSSRNGCG